MAILQNASTATIDVNDVRPGAKIKKDTLDDIAKNQAFIYEATTGEAAPNSGGASATAHIHDGSNGALMRLPLLQAAVDANLPGVATNNATVTPGWERFIFAPFPVPAGVAEVSVVLFGQGPFLAEQVRVVALDTSLSENEEPVFFERLRRGHYFDNSDAEGVFQCRVAVNGGAFNVLRVEAWAGKSAPGAADDDDGPFLEGQIRYVSSVHVLPVDQAPSWVWPAEEPASTSYETTSSVAGDADFVSFDANEFAAERTLDSRTLREMNLNTGRLHELLTGQPRPFVPNAARWWTGHNHADDGGADLDNSGVLVDTPLASWAYGVVRGINATDTLRPDFDETAKPTGTSWSGNIFAPILGSHVVNSTCAEHYLRIPATKSTHLTGTSKIKWAVLLWKVDTTSVTVGVTLTDEDGNNTDVEDTETTIASGRVLVTGEVDAEIDGSANTTQDGIAAKVRLRIQSASSKSQGLAVYGMALMLEA